LINTHFEWSLAELNSPVLMYEKGIVCYNAKNIFSFIRNLYSREKKQFILNMEDEIIKNTLIKEGN